LQSGLLQLCAWLRPSNIRFADLIAAKLLVSAIRKRRPKTRIVIRADSGFCRDWRLNWCENSDVGYILGLAMQCGAISAKAKQPWMHADSRGWKRSGRSTASALAWYWSSHFGQGYRIPAVASSCNSRCMGEATAVIHEGPRRTTKNCFQTIGEHGCLSHARAACVH
jgi:hypothetical protein